MDLYWTERAEKAVLAGEKSEKELLQSMQTVYKNSMLDIQKEINAFYGRYAQDNKLTIQEVNKRLNPQELLSAKEEIEKYYKLADKMNINRNLKETYKQELRLQSAKAYMSRLEELKVALKNEVIKLGAIEDVQFTDTLKKIYNDTYNSTSFDIDKYRGYSKGFYSLNDKKLKSGLKEKWLGDNYSDRIWKNKTKLLNQLETTFLQGVAQGQGPAKIARSMSKNYGTSFYNCVRLARTEGGHIMGEATKASYKEHNVQKYQYLATLDNRTSDVCKHLDGKVFLLKEAKEGVNYPEMHPNCRSTTVPYFEKDEIDVMFEEDVKIARDDDGKLYYVPASTTYEQWKDNTYEPKLVKLSKPDILIKAEKDNKFNFKVKETLMDIEDDAKNTNPYYMESINGGKVKGKKVAKYKYTENCQRCCPTYEMRRRGYDVIAKPLERRDGTDVLHYQNNWRKVFVEKDGKVRIYKSINSGTLEDLQNEIKQMGDGARVEIAVDWKGCSTGHVFMAENKNGNVYYIEPQDPNMEVIGINKCSYLKEIVPSSLKILRLDDLVPSDFIEFCCENRED